MGIYQTKGMAALGSKVRVCRATDCVGVKHTNLGLEFSYCRTHKEELQKPIMYYDHTVPSITMLSIYLCPKQSPESLFFWEDDLV